MTTTVTIRPHTGENPYGHNPKTWRKFLRNHAEQSANPVPDPEEYWDRHENVINDWSGPPAKGEAQLLKEAIEENLKGWPWKGVPRKLIMLAPYINNFHEEVTKTQEAVSDYLFKLPQKTQKSRLFTELLRAPGPISDRILSLLFQHHDASWKFWATCQEAGLVMAQNLGYWDFNSGYFGHCEEPRAQQDKNKQSRVALITIVAPIRRPEGTASYVKQIENMHSLCLSVYNFAENIRNIHFHRVPFLNTRLLALLIPKMRKLENLGIYKCQLIHVGDAMRLLEIIHTDRMLGKEDQVNLDFFPNYHVGPSEDLGKYCVGSYGVCWDNWGGDTNLAIWAMVCRIIPQARKQGMDWKKPHTAFRQWLEKSSCWRVDDVLVAFDQLSDPEYDVAEFVALVDCRNPDHFGDVRKFTSKIRHRPQGWKWATQKVPCDTCHTMVLGIFFWYLNVKPIVDEDGNIIPNRVLRCLGCKFGIVLNKEKDHYKQRKRNIIRTWLKDDEGEWNDANLLGAIEDITKKGVIGRAQKLDEARQYSIDENGEDPELEAVQRPISDAERWQRFSSHKRSPTVDDKKGDPKFMDADQKKWNLEARPERRNEHGY